ncbi:manganese/zinc/iron transport system substrate-binding protein [Haloechinothrix alba]|uniref:Manganese/zinc/iron transport system substrate-binding protein n=1 Tax=Haloechinothrix alba TaxID=664784 RepID=A0A238W1T2_9PSEU|nr:zinc ABC transporter substrate-binding protein [Haloechinothrix alba]SNR40565.1 manganese/zinc/iron transport system substrate-binding protein [Haloechinothrix alba]
MDAGSYAEHRRERQRERRREAALAGALALVVVLLAAGIIGYALRSGAAAGEGEDRLRVIATTNFLADTVDRVGGDDVTTTRLMGPGVDPHLYQARASDLDEMRAADAVFAVGLFLEGSLRPTLTELARTKPVALVGEQLDEDRLLEPEAGAPEGTEHDPHIWLDPRLWADVVDVIATELAELDPGNADAYRDRAQDYRADVLALHEEMAHELETIPERHRTLVTSHDAFQYFGRAFDMDVAAIQGISTEEEATTANISEVTELVTDAGVPTVFMESSVPRNTLDAVVAAAEQRGHEVTVGAELYGDAAGDDGTPEGTYIGMLRANAERIAAGLAGTEQ